VPSMPVPAASPDTSCTRTAVFAGLPDQVTVIVGAVPTSPAGVSSTQTDRFGQKLDGPAVPVVTATSVNALLLPSLTAVGAGIAWNVTLPQYAISFVPELRLLPKVTEVVEALADWRTDQAMRPPGQVRSAAR